MNPLNYYNKRTEYPKDSIELLDNLLYLNYHALRHLNIFNFYLNVRSCYQSEYILRFIINEVKKFISHNNPSFERIIPQFTLLDPEHNVVKVKYSKYVKRVLKEFDIHLNETLRNFKFEKRSLKEILGANYDQTVAERLVHTINILIYYYNIIPLNKKIEYFGRFNYKNVYNNLSEKMMNNITPQRFESPFYKKELQMPEVFRDKEHCYDISGLENSYTLFDCLRLFIIDELDKKFTKKSIRTKYDKLLDIDKMELDPLEILINKSVENVETVLLKELKNRSNDEISFDYRIFRNNETRIIIKMSQLKTNTDVYIVLSCTNRKSTDCYLHNFNLNADIYSPMSISTQIITSSRLIIFDELENQFNLNNSINDDDFTVFKNKGNDLFTGSRLDCRGGINLSTAIYSNNTRENDDLIIESLTECINRVNIIFDNIASSEDYMLKNALIDDFTNTLLQRLVIHRTDYRFINCYKRSQISKKILSEILNIYELDNRYPDRVFTIPKTNVELFVYLICPTRNDRDIIFLFTTDKKLSKLMNSRFEKKNLFALPNRVIKYLENMKREKEFYHCFSVKNELNDKPFTLEKIDNNLSYYAQNMKKELNINYNKMMNELNDYLIKNR